VHERIGLAIITDEEAEALHRVEELDRAGHTFTRQLPRRSCRLGRHGNDIANNLKILSGNLSATIHEVVLQFLPFGEAFKPGTFHSADMNEDVFAATFLLDEAEAFLDVEELHDALASADDLGWHTGKTAAACTAARAAARATGATRPTARTWRTAASTKPVTAATEAVSSEFARRRKTIAIAAKRIEAFFAKAVALVAAAPASPIVTHRSVRTLSHRPSSYVPVTWTASRTGHRRAELDTRCARRARYSAQKVDLRTILPACEAVSPRDYHKGGQADCTNACAQARAWA